MNQHYSINKEGEVERDYGQFKAETAVISGFERYEKENGADFGEVFEDFGPFFMIYRQGYNQGYFDGVY